MCTRPKALVACALLVSSTAVAAPARQAPVLVSQPHATACAATFAAGPAPSAAEPVAVAVDPGRNRLYVVHRDLYGDVAFGLAGPIPTNVVSVIDLASGATIATVALGSATSNDGRTQGIAVDLVRNRIFVTNSADKSVSIIDGTTAAVIGTTALSDPPTGIAVDSGEDRVYVTTSTGLAGSVVMLSASTGAQVGSAVALKGGAYGVAVDTSTHKAYVVEMSATVGVFDRATLQTELALGLTALSPKAIAVKNGSRAYASFQNIIAMVDISGATPTLLGTASQQSASSLGVDQSTGIVYATDTVNNALYFYNGDGTSAATPLPMQQLPVALALDSANQRVYVTDTELDGISIVNTATRAVTGRLLLGTTDFGIAYSDTTSNRLYAGNFGAGTIGVVNLADCSLAANWYTGDEPWSLAVDTALQQLYSLNVFGNQGTVVVQSTLDGSILKRISIGAAAAGRVAINKTTHQVYVTAGSTNNSNMTVIDGTNLSATPVQVAVGARAVGIAIDEAGDRVYVASIDAGTISVIRGSTNTVMGTPWKPPQTGVWGLALDATAGRLYVSVPANTIGSFNGVEVLDASTGQWIVDVPLQYGTASSRSMGMVAVNPVTHHVFAAVPNVNSVAMIDPNRSYAVTLAGAGNDAHDIAIDTSTGFVYVSNSYDGTVTAITDTATAPCTYAVSPLTQTFSSAGGSATETITTQTGCTWTAAADASSSWLSVTAGASGTSSGSVTIAATSYTGTTNRTGSVTIAGQAVSVTQTPPPSMTLDRTALAFGATLGGTGFASHTNDQLVRLVQTGTGGVTWTAAAAQPWLTVSPASGSGSATLNIGVVYASGLSANGTTSGTITITYSGASSASGSITITLTTTSAPAPPQGSFDTPVNGTTGEAGSIPVTGWALDDVEVTGVRILRAPVSGEAPGTLVPIGNAVMVDGARPDVAAAFPTLPRNTRAGWGYLLLTNFLPNLGNGTFTLYAYADDADGHSALLGTTTITCANATAIAPFGAIDTPGQGATVSGAVTNFGWVLSPGTRRADPPGGGTVAVVVDGAIGGSPSGWTSRADLSALFPAASFSGIGTALGVASFDSTALANGVHTLSWLVTDSQGLASGIGSRYFTVSNGSALRAADEVAPATASTLARDVSAQGAFVRGRRGFDLDAPYEVYGADSNGRITIEAEELDRVELQPGAGARGMLVGATGLEPLPIGSRLDPATGTFTWNPGVGFSGPYDLVFFTPDERLDVRIVLHQKGTGRVGPQTVIDAPASGVPVDAGQPLLVGGWALDLDATAGTGVDAVHVWAYAADGRVIFLGAAAYGGARLDVAALYGDRFRDSGYTIVTPPLVPGTYDIAVFPHSSVTGRFLPATTRRVVVK